MEEILLPVLFMELSLTSLRKKDKESRFGWPIDRETSRDMKKYIEYTYTLVRDIKVHDQEKYGLLIDGDRIKNKPGTTSVEQWL